MGASFGHFTKHVNNVHFYETSLFPHLDVLTNNHHIIAKELTDALRAREIQIEEENGQKLSGVWCGDNKMDEFFDQTQGKSGWLHWWSVEGEDPHQDWTVFPLVHEGKLATENCKFVPETAKLLSQVEGIRVGGFSRLKPNSGIETHCGFTGRKYHALTYHLGLIIPPAGDCFLACGPKVHRWTKQGQAIVFDDTFPHSAANETAFERVVLYVDFRIPEEIEPRLPEMVDPDEEDEEFFLKGEKAGSESDEEEQIIEPKEEVNQTAVQ